MRMIRSAAAGVLALALGAPSARAQAPVTLVPRPSLQVLESPVPSGPEPVPAAPAPPHHSLYRAALLSAIVPGLGEYYSGHRSRALVSGTLEAAVWTSYATFKVQENLRGDRAVEYAVAYASASGQGNDAYYKAVGQYLRAEGPGMWNEFVRRRARDTGEIVGQEYTGPEAWAWTSVQRFNDFRDLRQAQLRAGDHATNALAFALINRIVSVVSVVQAVRSDHMRGTRALSLRLDAVPAPGAPLWRVGLAGRF
jgi:hypothetical protein